MRAIRQAFWLGAASSALPAAASCLLDGTTIAGNATWSQTCILNSTLDIASKGFLRNDGTILNFGVITSQGRLDGSGSFDNQGTLVVGTGGDVRIAQSDNLLTAISAKGLPVFTGELSGGSWQVVGAKASLRIGNEPITINSADILLSGAGATFSQLSSLAENRGVLALASGNQLELGRLYNTGTVAVSSGARLRITKSNNLVGGTLTDGIWQVSGDGKGASGTLQVGSGQITTNAATVLLSGAGATFAQLSALTNNKGSLTVAAGHAMTLANLANTGTVTAADGGSLTIQQSSNLDGTKLDGGTWVVQAGGSLVVGSNQIAQNAATIVLDGPGAAFAQIDKLSSNKGALRVINGAEYEVQSLSNLGTLATETGGILSIAAKGTLTSDGTIRNAGVLRVEGKLRGIGVFHNQGSVQVRNGGNAVIEVSADLSEGHLLGGDWQVFDGSLAIGKGTITNNQASILLSGTSSKFEQLSGLTINQGSLTVAGGRNFTASRLRNSGTLVASGGSSLTLESSNNLSKGTLTAGRWVVSAVGGAGSKLVSSLVVGQGDIVTNDARIELEGSGARFDQIANLSANKGSLTLRSGRNMTFADLYNTGTLAVESGSSLTLTNSKNRNSGDLVGGTWVVDATSGATTSLAVGSGSISTNSARVELKGANAQFAQMNKLTINQGWLQVESGRSLQLNELLNTGTVVVGSGGSVDIGRSKSIGGTVLSDGSWQVLGTSDTARLRIGSDAIVTNQADVLLAGANAVFSQMASLRSNEGSLQVLDGHTLTLSSDRLTQTGSLVVGAGSALRWESGNGKGGNTFKFLQLSGDTRVDGSLTANDIRFDGGTLSGTGTLSSTVGILVGRDAVVQPGNSPGTLVLESQTVQFDGTLDIQIESPDSYDKLFATGDFTFGVASKVRFAFGFVPTDESYSFSFLQAASISGLPDYEVLGAVGPYASALRCGVTDCSFDLTRVEIPTPVPEPGAWAMLVAGMGVLGATVRRRRRRAPSAEAR